MTSASPDPYAALRDALSPHLGHRVTVSGAHSDAEWTVTPTDLQGANTGWRYAGFSVHCDTCNTPVRTP
jgi:hypothetical protein